MDSLLLPSQVSCTAFCSSYYLRSCCSCFTLLLSLPFFSLHILLLLYFFFFLCSLECIVGSGTLFSPGSSPLLFGVEVAWISPDSAGVSDSSVPLSGRRCHPAQTSYTVHLLYVIQVLFSGWNAFWAQCRLLFRLVLTLSIALIIFWPSVDPSLQSAVWVWGALLQCKQSALHWNS